MIKRRPGPGLANRRPGTLATPEEPLFLSPQETATLRDRPGNAPATPPGCRQDGVRTSEGRSPSSPHPDRKYFSHQSLSGKIAHFEVRSAPRTRRAAATPCQDEESRGSLDRQEASVNYSTRSDSRRTAFRGCDEPGTSRRGGSGGRSEAFWRASERRDREVRRPMRRIRRIWTSRPDFRECARFLSPAH